jgi:hypothetical protein
MSKANQPPIVVGSYVWDPDNAEGGPVVLAGPNWVSFLILYDRYGGPRISSQHAGSLTVADRPPLPLPTLLSLMATCGVGTGADAPTAVDIAPGFADLAAHEIRVGDVVGVIGHYAGTDEAIGGEVVAVVGPNVVVFRRPDGSLDSWDEPDQLRVLYRRPRDPA